MRRRFVCLTAATLLLAGCATTQPSSTASNDTFEGYNRAMFAFNEAVDRAVVKPTAQVYRRVLPDVVINSIGNFFSNLNDVVVLVNDLLQFKLHQATMDGGRIVANTTFGVAGLFDVATRLELPKHREDFGQTLGYWGIGDGPYLVLPLLGPSTVRDSFGLVGDYLTNPITWLSDSEPVSWSLWGLDAINRRSSLLRIERALAGEQIDPYAFQRVSYLQMRRNLVNDGQGTPPSFEEDAAPPAIPTPPP